MPFFLLPAIAAAASYVAGAGAAIAADAALAIEFVGGATAVIIAAD